MPSDVHSFSRPDEARVKHLVLDLDVDFDKQRLTGSATLQIEGSNPPGRIHPLPGCLCARRHSVAR